MIQQWLTKETKNLIFNLKNHNSLTTNATEPLMLSFFDGHSKGPGTFLLLLG